MSLTSPYLEHGVDIFFKLQFMHRLTTADKNAKSCDIAQHRVDIQAMWCGVVSFLNTIFVTLAYRRWSYG